MILEVGLFFVKVIATIMIVYVCFHYIRPVREGGSPVIGAAMLLIYLVSIWGDILRGVFL